MASDIAYIIVFVGCALTTVAGLCFIKWMILNWPADPLQTPAIIRWLQNALKH